MLKHSDYGPLGYERNPVYSNELTRYYGSYAIVVYGDATTAGTRYGFQVFNEDDEEAAVRGLTEYELFGLWSLDAAIEVADLWIADNL